MSLSYDTPSVEPAQSLLQPEAELGGDAQDTLGNAFLAGGPELTGGGGDDGGGWLDDVAGWALNGLGLGGDEEQVQDAGVPAGPAGALVEAMDGGGPEDMVEGAQASGPGNTPTRDKPVSEFADTAVGMFDKVAGKNGRISGEDIDKAMQDPNLTTEQAATLATLKNLQDKIKGASDDDTLWENGISLADLQAFQKSGTLPKDLQDSINGDYAFRKDRINNSSTDLFGKNADGTTVAPDANAIRQGSVNDCWFLSAMGSVAYQNPNAIKDMIVPNKDGTYTVTFPNGKSATVNAPTKAELAYGATSGQNGMWANLMEKAYANVENNDAWFKKTNPIDQIDQARTPDNGTNVFSANGSSDSDFLALTSADTTARKMEDAMANGRSVNALVGSNLLGGPGPDGLPTGHIYAVEAYDPKTRTITLRNPWGHAERQGADGKPKDGSDDGTFTVTVEEFNKMFTTASYAEQGPTKAENTPVPSPGPTPTPAPAPPVTPVAPPAPTVTPTPTATTTPDGATKAAGAEARGASGPEKVDAAASAGPGNAPTAEEKPDTFADTALGMFDKLADKNGVITPAALDKAMSDPTLSPREAAALATMKNLKDELKKVSDDETLWETNITRADLEAFQASGKVPQELMDKVNGDYAFRENRINNASSELYAKDANGNEKLPDFNAISQGSIGDCYFLAALGSAAAQNPQAVHDMVKPNDNGTYTVTFPNGKTATVNGPTKQEIATYATSGQDGMWASVIEKAYGQIKNDEAWFKKDSPTDKADGGDFLSAGVNMFSKNGDSDTDMLMFTSKETTAQKLQDAFANGKVVTAGINGRLFGEDEPGGLPSGHAYSVVGYDADKGTVTLRNPWGVGGDYGSTFTMTLDEFDKKFSDISYAEAGLPKGETTPTPTPEPTPGPTPTPEPTPTPTPTPVLGPTPTPVIGPTPTPVIGPTPGPAPAPSRPHRRHPPTRHRPKRHPGRSWRHRRR